MEASTLQPAATLAKPRITIGPPLLRFRSDEQLVALFRAGYEEAFRAIHDRYHKRLFAYARQMLPGRQDAEDALQDVFVRAYSGLRASDRDLALRAWLFRVAHNRCIDELRRPAPPPPEVLYLVRTAVHDPLAEVDLRESLRRVVEDIRRLPDQQRSALLMRELAGMSYAELASSLGISVGAVKSLLVRARLALAQASAARDTACAVIREHLVEAHDRGVRPNANARKHLRDCSGCKHFRYELRGVSRQLAAVAPTIGPLGVFAKLLGFSGGGGAAGGAGGGAALLGGGGTAASTGGIAVSANHLATLIVAAVATAGGAVGIQHTILPTPGHATHTRSASPKHKHALPLAPPNGVSAIQAATDPQQEIIGTNPSATLSGNANSGTTATQTRPVKSRTDPAASTGSGALKHHSRSTSSTAAGSSTVTAGTEGSGSCTTSGSTTSTSDTSSTSTSTSSTAPTTASAPTSTSSNSTSAAPSTACDSTTGSSSGSGTSSTGSSTSGSGSGTGSTSSTSDGSGSGAVTGPVTSTGSSQGGSGTTTG